MLYSMLQWRILQPPSSAGIITLGGIQPLTWFWVLGATGCAPTRIQCHGTLTWRFAKNRSLVSMRVLAPWAWSGTRFPPAKMARLLSGDSLGRRRERVLGSRCRRLGSAAALGTRAERPTPDQKTCYVSHDHEGIHRPAVGLGEPFTNATADGDAGRGKAYSDRK